MLQIREEVAWGVFAAADEGGAFGVFAAADKGGDRLGSVCCCR